MTRKAKIYMWISPKYRFDVTWGNFLKSILAKWAKFIGLKIKIGADIGTECGQTSNVRGGGCATSRMEADNGIYCSAAIGL